MFGDGQNPSCDEPPGRAGGAVEADAAPPDALADAALAAEPREVTISWVGRPCSTIYLRRTLSTHLRSAKLIAD
jgi:hypothetical protein